MEKRILVGFFLLMNVSIIMCSAPEGDYYASNNSYGDPEEYCHEKFDTSRPHPSWISYVVDQEETISALRSKCSSVLRSIQKINCDKNGKIVDIHYVYQYSQFFIENDLCRHWQDLQELEDSKRNVEKKLLRLQSYSVDINAQDNLGKTALDHCKTADMYNFLRNNGAHFQWKKWIYMNQKKTLFLGASAGFITALTIIMIVNNQKESFYKKLELLAKNKV